MFLCITGAAFAQVTNSPNPAAPQTTTQEDQATPATNADRKADFNYPQSPNRPANIPSEDTLIKSQRTSGAIIHDTLMPSSDKKADKSSMRKDRKGTAEMDDSTFRGNKPGRKPKN